MPHDTHFDKFLEKGIALRERIESEGICVRPGSRLSIYLSAVRSLAERGDSASQREALVAHRAVNEIDVLDDVVVTLAADPAVCGWAIKLREALGGAALRTEEIRHTSARDIQFELLVATVLRKAGYEVTLSEPDIQVHLPSGLLSIAAKRPRSGKKMVVRVKEASDQIVRSGCIGLIALDISCVMDPADRTLVSRDFAAALELARYRVNRFVRDNAPLIRRDTADAVIGVLVHMAVPIWQPTERRLAYAQRWTLGALIPDDDPRADILFGIHDRVSRVGMAS